MKKPAAVPSEMGTPLYTRKQVRKFVHDAFKAGLINVYQARPDNNLAGQNTRLYALKRLFPKIFTEGQPGHVTRQQEQAARIEAKRLAAKADGRKEGE